MLRFAIVVAIALPACRVVGPVVADAAREPFPDAAADTDGNHGADVVGGGQPCDLVLQNCVDSTRACYRVDDQPGVTTCAQPPGSAPPISGCVSSFECDAREVCVLVPESLLTMCATICDPDAAVTGCLPKAPCVRLTGFRAGYCVP